MIKLEKLTHEYKKQFFEMMEEWTSQKETIIPYMLTKIDYKYFDIFIKLIEKYEAFDLKVKVNLYMCIDTNINKIIGAVAIRETLTPLLLQRGGHVAYGVRPSMRNKGYGTQIIKLACEKCLEFGIKKVLFVCENKNIYSRKAILKNNAIFENEININNTIIQRYWINN